MPLGAFFIFKLFNALGVLLTLLTNSALTIGIKRKGGGL